MTVDIGPCPAGWYALLPSLPVVVYAAEPDAALNLLCDYLERMSPPTPALH